MSLPLVSTLTLALIHHSIDLCPSSPTLSAPQFDYYGAQTPLRTVANISTPESTLLVVQVGAAGWAQNHML